MTTVAKPAQSLQALWSAANLSSTALERLQLSGLDPALPSSFAVGSAAQAAIAAAALSATEVGRLRNGVAGLIAQVMWHC